MSPKNGDIRLVTRLSMGWVYNGVKKWGLHKVYQKFERSYANYDAADWECWYNYCWEDQPEYLL